MYNLSFDKKKNRLSNYFKRIGEYSLDIYMQHVFFTNYLFKFISGKNVSPFWGQVITLVFAIIITLFCLFVSRYILHKIPIYRTLMLGEINSTSSKKFVKYS